MKKYFSWGLVSMTCLLISISGCNNNDLKSKKVYTTLDRNISPRNTTDSLVDIDRPQDYLKNGYGKWYYSSGIPYDKRTDLMPKEFDISKVVGSDTLMRFFTMTDIHITDEESPAQAIYFHSDTTIQSTFAISLYSPLMLYTTQVLDAAVETINKLNKKEKIDFGLVLGDLANNSQYNEYRWFIDILDGKEINPDSGVDDDPIAGPNNDHQDKFKAVGLNDSIPWYVAIGNHDHFWMGSKVANIKLRKTLIGNKILKIGDLFKDSTSIAEETYSTGVIDGNSINANIIGSGAVAEMAEIPNVALDINRRHLSAYECIEELSITDSKPIGHGFKSSVMDTTHTCYSFEPKSELPCKIIVLDNTQTVDKPTFICGHGSLSHGRYEWLLEQLKEGQENDKLMIIASHVPIAVAIGSEVGWTEDYDEKKIITEMQKYPNLILWVAGHRHVNTITAFKSKDSNHPENGFWEVETKSLREFPQQFRTIDIVHNSDNSLSMFATNVDPDIRSHPFAALSRSRAIGSMQIYGTKPDSASGPDTYNAELLIKLTPKMEAKIKHYTSLH